MAQELVTDPQGVQPLVGAWRTGPGTTGRGTDGKVGEWRGPAFPVLPQGLREMSPPGPLQPAHLVVHFCALFVPLRQLVKSFKAGTALSSYLQRLPAGSRCTGASGKRTRADP